MKDEIMKHRLVDSIETDPDIFVYLKKGYKYGSDFSQDGRLCQHCFGEDSMKDVKSSLKTMIEVCTCDTCVN